MDELLINASLQERNPASLPWSIDGKENNKEDVSVDKSTGPLDKGMSMKIEHNQMRELDETCERRCNDGSRYMSVDPGVNLPNETESVEIKKVFQLVDLTHFGDNRLSTEDVTHSASEYSAKIPMLYTVNKQIYTANKEREKQVSNPAAACFSECDAKTQNTRRISPRCSLKVSRKMIKESKLGTSVPLQFERTVSRRKDEMSLSSTSPLEKENEYKTKQMKQGQVNVNLQGEGCLRKNLDGPVCISVARLKRENHSTVSNNVDACSALDLNIDNELDDLLELTADAVNYRSNMRVKGNESTVLKKQLGLTQSKNDKIIHDDSITFNSKDNKNKDSSVPNDLATVRSTANCELGKEDESKQKQWNNTTYKAEEGITAINCPTDKVVDVMYRNDDIQKRSVKNTQVKELGTINKRDVSQDIRTKMDIIDGIGVESVDTEAQETQRKKPNTKKTKREKRQEKKEGCVVLETENEPRNTRRIGRNNKKDDKYKEIISRGNDVRDEMSTLMDKPDNEEDIFGISPIKNKETLSDLEDYGIHTYANYMERKPVLEKGDDRKKLNKNGKVDAVYSYVTKVMPDQTKVPSKDKPKRSRNKKKERGTRAIKKKDTKPVDEQNLHKKQKKRKSKKVSKTSVKDALLPTEESSEGKKNDHGRHFVKIRDVVTKTKTSKVNLHVLKTENEITHSSVVDQNDSHKISHRLRSTKSYTIIKHNVNPVTRIDMRVNNECDIDKDSRGSGNPFIRQQMNQKNVIVGNEGKPFTDEDISRENHERYKDLSDSSQTNLNDINTTNGTKTKDCSVQGNINNFQYMKISDLMCDSDKDSDKISDIQYQQYLTHRPPSETPSEFEFPRPASNRTFIIDFDNGDGSTSLHEETGCCNEQDNKEGRKLSKKQRLINFIMCCFRPETD